MLLQHTWVLKMCSISRMVRYLIFPAAIFWTITRSASSHSWHVAPGSVRPFHPDNRLHLKHVRSIRRLCAVLPQSLMSSSRHTRENAPFWLTNTLPLNCQEKFSSCCRLSKWHMWHWHYKAHHQSKESFSVVDLTSLNLIRYEYNVMIHYCFLSWALLLRGPHR